jgi:hypothetical protein
MRILLYRLCLPFLGLILLAAHPAAAQNLRPGEGFPINKYYYQCAARMGPTQGNNPGFKDPHGYIGIFQFSVVNAYEAGLCSQPAPAMRTEQLWKLCDFKGPIADKYNIRSQYDLRFNAKARAAQLEMMRNLTAKYDDYIYQRKYDLFFGKYIHGVNITPDILRALLHAQGRAAVDDFLRGNDVYNSNSQSVYTLATCLNQCLVTHNQKWLCN